MTNRGGIAKFERSLIRKRCEEGIQLPTHSVVTSWLVDRRGAPSRAIGVRIVATPGERAAPLPRFVRSGLVNNLFFSAPRLGMLSGDVG